MAEARKRPLDFTNVKDSSGINPKRMPEGDYVFTLIAVTEEESKEGNDYWQYAARLDSKPSCVYPLICALTPEALWKVREVFTAAGVEVPKKKVNDDPNCIVGKKIGGTLEDDEYEGREKSVIRRTFPAADVDEEPMAEPPRQADTRKAGKGRAAAPEPPDDDDIDESDLDALDLDDL